MEQFELKTEIMDTQKIISLIIVVALFIVVREGFQQRDRVEPENGYSKAWHWFGFLIRLMVAGIMFQSSKDWLLTGLTIFILWPVYNIACNIGAKQKWYYLSKSGIDLIIRKCLPFINFDKK